MSDTVFLSSFLTITLLFRAAVFPYAIANTPNCCTVRFVTATENSLQISLISGAKT